MGVPGEVHIGGDSLTRGYLSRPRLTAERYIPNPFSQKPGSRMYRSGDRARYWHDGTIEFLGRVDHQVKVRGFRIELGEIEAVLAQHWEVRETVVLVQEGVPGNKRLVAYVVAEDGQKPGVRELLSFLGERLPGYMVPSVFVMLEELPLTPNGKADRRALLPPDGSGLGLEKTYVAPRTPTEEMLARIWVQVLGVEQVGVADDFFELGGHSLLATRVVARVCDVFKVELPLRVIFETSTLAGFAQVVDALLQMEPLTTIPAITSYKGIEEMEA